jgi:undecaprenyl-diphosphatase
MQRILSWLQQIDIQLFYFLNRTATNSFLDAVAPWWRHQNTWLPLYVFLLLFVFMNFGWKIWPWLIFVALTITCTDQISSHVLKLWLQRPRPCNDASLTQQVRLLLAYCPGNPSFPSSHATNHFGIAAFLYFTLNPVIHKWGYWFFVWAATICYAQIYIGIHYPFDIFAGAVVGFCIGSFIDYLYNRFIGLPALQTQISISKE